MSYEEKLRALIDKEVEEQRRKDQKIIEKQRKEIHDLKEQLAKSKNNQASS